MTKQFTQHLTKEVNPPKWGWYQTDKGLLFWYEQEKQWSCNDERLSEEYPKYWYQENFIASELLTALKNLVYEEHEVYAKEAIELLKKYDNGS